MSRPKYGINFFCAENVCCADCKLPCKDYENCLDNDASKIAALLDALKELGDMKTIVAWIRELRDQKKIFIFDGSGRFDPKHIIVADDYPRPDDEGAI